MKNICCAHFQSFLQKQKVCQVNMQENSLHFSKMTTCWVLKESGGKFLARSLHYQWWTVCNFWDHYFNAFLKWPSESLYYVEESVERFFVKFLKLYYQVKGDDFLHNTQDLLHNPWDRYKVEESMKKDFLHNSYHLLHNSWDHYQVEESVRRLSA